MVSAEADCVDLGGWGWGWERGVVEVDGDTFGGFFDRLCVLIWVEMIACIIKEKCEKSRFDTTRTQRLKS